MPTLLKMTTKNWLGESVSKSLDLNCLHHQPVLLSPTIQHLISDNKGIYIDCTLGFGGHTSEILSTINQKGSVLCFDRDPAAVNFCKDRFKNEPRVQIFHENFRDLEPLITTQGLQMKINGMLLDLGLSSFQIENTERGFSFQTDGPLDMRFNPSESKSAADIINTACETTIANIIYQFGEERTSRRIAKKILEKRQNGKIETTDALATIIKSVSNNVKTLARVFQAFRIAVNDEFGALKEVLNSAISILKPGGRIVAISYHSLEDRIVKHFFKDAASNCSCPPTLPICQCEKQQSMKILTRKPIVPSAEEIKDNPRARSAKLRIAEKV